MTRTEWRRAPFFAEVAEVLGISTEYVMAVKEDDDDRLLVLYTPNYEDGDNTIWSVMMKPGADQILVLDSVPRAHPGAWEEIERKVMEGLGE